MKIERDFRASNHCMNSGLYCLHWIIFFIGILSLHLYHRQMTFVRKLFTTSVPIIATMSPFRNTQKLFRVVSIGGLVVSLLPSPVQAARMDGNPNNEGEKSNTKKNDGEAFDFEKLLASQLAEGGALNGVKKLFESGVPSQFGYGFLMGYSSGFCLKKVMQRLSR